MVDHSAATIDRFQVGSDGKTSYERRRGKKFQKELAEFSECVWYLKAKSKSTPDIKSRWANGVWLGIREESNEIIIGTSEGVIKTRTIRRKADPKDSWNADELNAMKGTPWQPVPGGPDQRIPIRVRPPDQITAEEGEKVAKVAEREVKSRALKIMKKDLDKYGYTVNCRGCDAAKMGEGQAAHSTECRARITDKLTEDNDPRVTRENVRLARAMEGMAEPSGPVAAPQVQDAPMEEDPEDEEQKLSESGDNQAHDDQVSEEMNEEICIEEGFDPGPVSPEIFMDNLGQAWTKGTTREDKLDMTEGYQESPAIDSLMEIPRSNPRRWHDV